MTTISSTQKTNRAPLKSAVEMVVNSDIVGLDLETTGLDPRKDRIRLVQVSDGIKTYVIDAFKVNPRSLIEALAVYPDVVITHGGSFEWAFIYRNYRIALDNLVDTCLMARIAAGGDMSVRRDLGEVARELLGLELDKDMQNVDWTEATLSKRHLDYAATDAAVLPHLYNLLNQRIAETHQERVADLEHAALPAFALMKLVGMPVDKDAWDEQAEAKEAELRRLEREMLEAPWMPQRAPMPQTWALQGADCLAMLHAAGFTEVTGTTAKDLKDYGDNEIVKRLLVYRKAKGKEREDAKASVLELAPKKPLAAPPVWNFGSPQQVGDIVYELLGFEVDSTDEGTLLRYRDYHPFFKRMLEHRKLKKLTSTYGKGWFQKAYDAETGRVYPAFRQIGTSTGCVSSGEQHVAPNAQNLPGSYRKFFVAPQGRVFVDADYSQIEIRVVAKLLGEKVLLELFEGDTQDVYQSTAAYLLGVGTDEVTEEQRDLAKAIVLGMLYGLSARGLPYYVFKNYGITDMSKEDAEAYVQAFYDLYPKIAQYHEDVLERLEADGGVNQRTLTGRLRANITNRNEGINAPVQGTAADGLKAAMALTYERLKKFGGTAFIINTLHDELLIECDEKDGLEVKALVDEAMLEAMNEILNTSEPYVKLKVKSGVTKVWTKG